MTTQPRQPAAPKPATRARKVTSNSFPTEAERRKWFADMMWQTFPGSSLSEKARRASPVVRLTARQCENLMKCEHDAKLGTIAIVLSLAGAEQIFSLIRGR